MADCQVPNHNSGGKWNSLHLWKQHLLQNNLQSVFEELQSRQLVEDDLILYLNDIEVNQLCTELQLDTIDSLKLKSIVRKIKKHQHSCQSITYDTEDATPHSFLSQMKHILHLLQQQQSLNMDIYVEHIKNMTNKKFDLLIHRLHDQRNSILQQIDQWKAKRYDTITEEIKNINHFVEQFSMSNSNTIYMEHINKRNMNRLITELTIHFNDHIFNVNQDNLVEITQSYVKLVDETDTRDTIHVWKLSVVIICAVLFIMMNLWKWCKNKRRTVKLIYHSHRKHCNENNKYHPINLLNSNDHSWYSSALNADFASNNEFDWIVFTMGELEDHRYYLPQRVYIQNSRYSYGVSQMSVWIGNERENDWKQFEPNDLNVSMKEDKEYFVLSGISQHLIKASKWKQIKFVLQQNHGVNLSSLPRFVFYELGVEGVSIS
eukprot:58881_1